MLLCASGRSSTLRTFSFLSSIDHLLARFFRNAISAINWSIVDESQMLDRFGRYTYRLKLCSEHRIGMASTSLPGA